MNALFSRIEIRDESGVIQARQEARTIAERLGFPARDRLGISSAVTHAACEAVRHAGGARVEYWLEGENAPSLAILVVDHSRPDLEASMGPPRDFEPANHWMDRFDVNDRDGKPTEVSMARRLPERTLPVDPALLARIAEELLEFRPTLPVAEILDQDLALFRSFDEIEARRRERDEIPAELEDARQGILALHLELTERAGWLRSAHDLKTRFLSRLSHELRTPIASILGLTRLLLGRADGELSDEQERQVSFILRAAHDLSRLINDLLDLSRMEAGRETLQLSRVDIPPLFAALRGMFRPLIPVGSNVSLSFDEPGPFPSLWTDEAKLGQILRNFLSNALKFTERGEIHVKAAIGPGETVIFSVVDTGLGIAPEDLERIFEEFGQLERPDHPTPPGTGLGLPLARKLARALGGQVDVRSDPGVGSTFTLTIPIRHDGQANALGDVLSND